MITGVAPIQHPLWNRLIKDHQDMGVLVEGPLNNLRKNEMHVSKPLKLYNKRNPVGVFVLVGLMILTIS